MRLTADEGVPSVPVETLDRRCFDPAIETMSRRDIDVLQGEMLADALAYVDAHVPIYEDLWRHAGIRSGTVHSLDDLRDQVPLMSKDDIRAYRAAHADPFGGLARASDVAVVTSSSGTTGDPILHPGSHDHTSAKVGLARDWWEIGARPGDAIALMLFTFRGPAMLMPHVLGASTVLFDHHPGEFDRWCRASLALRPTVLYVFSGPLILAMRHMEEAGMLPYDLVDVFASYHGAVIGGDLLGGSARATLERWGVTPFLHTAVGDVGSATECREHDGLHAPDDSVLIEIIDPDTLLPVAVGDVGEMVVTSLRPRESNPLVRYRSEDLVRATTETCGCGRTSTRLWPLGRRGDEVIVDGRAVLPGSIWDAIESVPECGAGLFQVIRRQRQMDTLEVRVGYDPDVAGRSGAALRGALVDAIAAAAGVEPQVELVPYDALLRLGPPHKIPRVARQ